MRSSFFLLTDLCTFMTKVRLAKRRRKTKKPRPKTGFATLSSPTLAPSRAAEAGMFRSLAEIRGVQRRSSGSPKSHYDKRLSLFFSLPNAPPSIGSYHGFVGNSSLDAPLRKYRNLNSSELIVPQKMWIGWKPKSILVMRQCSIIHHFDGRIQTEREQS